VCVVAVCCSVLLQCVVECVVAVRVCNECVCECVTLLTAGECATFNSAFAHGVCESVCACV